MAEFRIETDRLGMRYCPDMDFEHPKFPQDSPLLPHVTYRLDLHA